MSMYIMDMKIAKQIKRGAGQVETLITEYQPDSVQLSKRLQLWA